jgi:hypothetical protein
MYNRQALIKLLRPKSIRGDAVDRNIVPELSSLEELNVSAVRYRAARSPLSPPVSILHLRSIKEYLAMEMVTAAKNNVTTNLYQRCRKYLKARYDLTGRQVYLMLKQLFIDEDEDDDLGPPPRTAFGGNPVVDQLRDMLPVTPTKANMQQKPQKFLKLMRFIQHWNGMNTHVKGVRNFSLIPNTDGFTTKCITIDTCGLRAMLARVDPETPSEPRFLAANRLEAWRRLFNINKVMSDKANRTSQRQFGLQVRTDGKTVHVMMRRPKKEEEEAKELKAEDYDLQWGVDPGWRDMYVASNDRGETIKCSSKEFYEEAKYKYSSQKLKTWKAMEPHIAGLVGFFV